MAAMPFNQLGHQLRLREFSARAADCTAAGGAKPLGITS
jgi:hypothetical protein